MRGSKKIPPQASMHRTAAPRLIPNWALRISARILTLNETPSTSKVNRIAMSEPLRISGIGPQSHGNPDRGLAVNSPPPRIGGGAKFDLTPCMVIGQFYIWVGLQMVISMPVSLLRIKLPSVKILRPTIIIAQQMTSIHDDLDVE